MKCNIEVIAYAETGWQKQNPKLWARQVRVEPSCTCLLAHVLFENSPKSIVWILEESHVDHGL